MQEIVIIREEVLQKPQVIAGVISDKGISLEKSCGGKGNLRKLYM